AAAAYQQALDRDPNSTDALRGLMNTYIQQSRTDAALAAAKSQISKEPTNATYYDLLGTLLFRGTKDLDGAEAALSKSLSLDRSNADAAIKLIQVQQTRGELDRAIASCYAGAKAFPQNSEFFILLGDTYRTRQQWQNATDAYRQALKVQPQ